MKPIPLLNTADFISWTSTPPGPNQRQYFSMYSSIFGGIVTDPRLMLVPVDDHLVHRGDGIFETFKCVEGALYNMRAHLDRLRQSARGIALDVPWSPEQLEHIVIETVRRSGQQSCLVRMLVSRGPGSLGVNPYDSPAPALYVVVSQFKRPFMEEHPGGARVISSSIPVKPRPFANIKSTNYLFNVLMKKEAVDAGVDFVVAFDENGFLAEGPTENAGLVTTSRVLQFPKPDRILTGTTMQRVLALAEALVKTGELAGLEKTDISRDAVRNAAEVMIFGTTPDVTAVVEFDGQPVGDGRPGPVFRQLAQLLHEDIHRNPALRIPV